MCIVCTFLPLFDLLGKPHINQVLLLLVSIALRIDYSDEGLVQDSHTWNNYPWGNYPRDNYSLGQLLPRIMTPLQTAPYANHDNYRCRLKPRLHTTHFDNYSCKIPVPLLTTPITRTVTLVPALCMPNGTHPSSKNH